MRGAISLAMPSPPPLKPAAPSADFPFSLQAAAFADTRSAPACAVHSSAASTPSHSRPPPYSPSPAPERHGNVGGGGVPNPDPRPPAKDCMDFGRGKEEPDGMGGGSRPARQTVRERSAMRSPPAKVTPTSR